MDRKKNSYYNKLKKVVDVKEDGSYKFDMSYFIYHFADRMPSKKLCNLLDGPPRKPEEQVNQRHKDIAAAVQLIYEEILFKILNHVYKETKCENIVIAGGCGLNSVANGKILRNTKFMNILIQPYSSYGGTSIGAAFYLYNTILENKRTFVMKDVYLGPGFSKDEVKVFLKNNKIKYHEFKDEKTLIKKISRLNLDIFLFIDIFQSVAQTAEVGAFSVFLFFRRFF